MLGSSAPGWVVFQAAVALGPLLASACVVLAGPEAGALVAALLIGIATALYLGKDRAACPPPAPQRPGAGSPPPGCSSCWPLRA
ncbi:hypothetical protein ACFS27_15745 [Promicromonospora vindobonensis]|uniref:Uncharacterized protein n=1 Tax=Promicromonospora vindobonensis TaxID=195748 RepID=A0ABW5VY35_9MICO